MKPRLPRQLALPLTAQPTPAPKESLPNQTAPCARPRPMTMSGRWRLPYVVQFRPVLRTDEHGNDLPRAA